MRKVLTAKGIISLLPAAAGKRYDVMDALVPGFGVRVTATGHKTYVMIARYRGQPNPTRRVIAEVGTMDLLVARDTARAWLAKIVQRVDPAKEHKIRQRQKRAEEERFFDVAEYFLEAHVRRNKLRSVVEIERIFNKHFYPRWRNLEFVSARRGDVARLLDDIERTGPVQADKVLSQLSVLFNWYQARNEDYTSPIVRGMRRTKPGQRRRKRILNDDELRMVWQATETAGIYGGLVRTALLTAQRRSKVLTMRWEDISEDGVWTIRMEEREKSNAELLQLPQIAHSVIRAQPLREDSDLVFAGRYGKPLNGYSKAKRQLDERLTELNGAPLPHWVLHDLRRTAKSLMARSGVWPDISERVLGHAIEGVEGIYDRYTYEAEKADALARLADMMAWIVDGKPDGANVIPLRFARTDSRPGLRSTG
jgi:integrase